MNRSDTSNPAGPYSQPPAQLDLDRLPAFQGIALADPDSVAHADGAQLGSAGDLVLLIGADEQAMRSAIGSPGAERLAGIVLPAPGSLPATSYRRASALAAERGVPLYTLPLGLTWAQAHRAIAAALAVGRAPDRSAESGLFAADDDLAGLAQTIATLTGGLVSIEDTAARVLAYSRSSDEVDDLRRLSILGRSGPADYLALLREWGVYDRLAASEEVVEIAEHPESGVRRRLAVGIFAGGRQLGTIWVQQGEQEFGPHAAQALLGAARLTAAHLIDRQTRARPPRGGEPASIDLEGLLAGQSARSAGVERRLADRPCVVLAFDTSAEATDRSAHRLMLDGLTRVITVHAAAFRRNAAAAVVGTRAYLLLPAVESADAAHRVAGAIVDAARRHLDAAIVAAIGPIVPTVDAAAVSRTGADLALAESIDRQLQVRGDSKPGPPVTDFALVRPTLVVDTAIAAVAARVELRHPGIEQLVATDREAAETLLAYLDSGSRAQAVADILQLHVTTVRYRLRKAEAALDVDWDAADERLATHLQLRFVLRPAPVRG